MGTVFFVNRSIRATHNPLYIDILGRENERMQSIICHCVAQVTNSKVRSICHSITTRPILSYVLTLILVDGRTIENSTYSPGACRAYSLGLARNWLIFSVSKYLPSSQPIRHTFLHLLYLIYHNRRENKRTRYKFAKTFL